MDGKAGAGEPRGGEAFTSPVPRPPSHDAVLYAMTVMHRRHVAPLYRFLYRIFYVLFDVDQLDALARRLRLFSHNRFNVISFYDADHGSGAPGGLRAWAEGVCAREGIALAGGRIRLLAQPRMFGWAFNPISLWYCEHADGTLRALIAEVRNTFGEKHSYLLGPQSLAVPPASGAVALPYDAELVKGKCFHVSPLFDLVGNYHFSFSEPGARIRVLIHEKRLGAPLLDATMAGAALPFENGQILRQVLKMPVQAVKVLAGIHWQALKIWLRGARFHKKPPPPTADIS